MSRILDTFILLACLSLPISVQAQIKEEAPGAVVSDEEGELIPLGGDSAEVGSVSRKPQLTSGENLCRGGLGLHLAGTALWSSAYIAGIADIRAGSYPAYRSSSEDTRPWRIAGVAVMGLGTLPMIAAEVESKRGEGGSPGLRGTGGAIYYSLATTLVLGSAVFERVLLEDTMPMGLESRLVLVSAVALALRGTGEYFWLKGATRSFTRVRETDRNRKSTRRRVIVVPLVDMGRDRAVGSGIVVEM